MNIYEPVRPFGHQSPAHGIFGSPSLMAVHAEVAAVTHILHSAGRKFHLTGKS
jgi:hypothetical protein